PMRSSASVRSAAPSPGHYGLSSSLMHRPTVSELGLDIFQLRNTVLDTAQALVTPHETIAPMLDDLVIIQLVEIDFPMDAYTSAAANPSPEDCVITIVSIGFSIDQDLKTLWDMNNSLEQAIDWIFSHIDDLAAMDISEGCSAESVLTPKVQDSPGKYQLFAFISHMAASTMCVHYVCHIKKEGKWVIYNNQKMCASKKLPKDLGYIYFYQRDLPLALRKIATDLYYAIN
ncbi:hypothetical protein A6R68_07600, partial [Neotoma lepida]